MGPLPALLQLNITEIAPKDWSDLLVSLLTALVGAGLALLGVYLNQRHQDKKDRRQEARDRYRDRTNCYLRYQGSARYFVECVRLYETYAIDTYYHENAMNQAKSDDMLEIELHKHGLLYTHSELDKMELELAKARKQFYTDIADIQLNFDSSDVDALMDKVITSASSYQPTQVLKEDEIGRASEWRDKAYKEVVTKGRTLSADLLRPSDSLEKLLREERQKTSRGRRGI